MTNSNNKYALFLLFVFAVILTSAQERDTTLTQQVEVVKAYKPTISDAFKIIDMPPIEVEEHQKPNFNYNIYSKPIYNTFSVNTLKAATISQKPREDTGFGLVKAGFGNYNKPYGEVFFNSQNSRNTIFGLHGKHLSSHGNINLTGGNKVKAPFSENEAEMYVKHLFRGAVLSVNLNFDHNGFNYYGYPEDSIPMVIRQEDQKINYQGKKQTFSKGGLDINLVNQTAGSNDVKFDFNFLYSYFGTKTNQREHFAEFMADVQKPFDRGTGMIEAGVTFVQANEIFNKTLLATGKSQQIWLTAQPAYYLGNEMANIKVGFKSWFVMDNDVDVVAKLAPDIRVNFAPVKDIINIYAGIDGNYINNHYSKIAYENPFVNPTHDVQNTMEKFRFYGGFDGKFATKTNFKLSVDYSMFSKYPFYYLNQNVIPVTGATPNPSVINNTFNLLYDDMDMLKLNLEIFHASSEKADLILSGNYYIYKLDAQKEAWNLPDWDTKLSLGYKINDQLSVSSDIYLIGKRTALIVELTSIGENSSAIVKSSENEEMINKSYILDTVVDLNFMANYKITQNFSVFASLNNFGFQKYERWFGYPVQSFNFLGGITYTF